MNYIAQISRFAMALAASVAALSATAAPADLPANAPQEQVVAGLALGLSVTAINALGDRRMGPRSCTSKRC